MNPMQNQGSSGQKTALDGLRVVDISMGWAGPLAAMLLADFGAEIIKVESTRHMDWWRGNITDPDPDVRPYEKSPLHNGVNRNKRGITLDLKDPSGVAYLKELLAISDVMVENFAPRVMENFGLTYDVVRSINPSLVMISMPGFGSTGPWRNYVGFGNTLEALSGIAGLTGHADGPPVFQSNAYGDPVSGIGGAIGLLMALVHRRRTGEGQHIEMAHQELIVQHTAQSLMDYVMNGRVQERRGNRHPWMAPHGVYPCAGEDNWIAIAVASDQEWHALCEALGRPEIAADARFEDALSRWHHQDELDEIISGWTAQWEKAELAERLQGVGVAAEPVNSAKEVLEDRQV
ncbi:MAG: CoA transferase, partial [Chloroflexi bacterium]|nr:CoA transferase [Chloroflexota bacterium]